MNITSSENKHVSEGIFHEFGDACSYVCPAVHPVEAEKLILGIEKSFEAGQPPINAQQGRSFVTALTDTFTCTDSANQLGRILTIATDLWLKPKTGTAQQIERCENEAQELITSLFFFERRHDIPLFIPENYVETVSAGIKERGRDKDILTLEMLTNTAEMNHPAKAQGLGNNRKEAPNAYNLH